MFPKRDLAGMEGQPSNFLDVKMPVKEAVVNFNWELFVLSKVFKCLNLEPNIFEVSNGSI